MAIGGVVINFAAKTTDAIRDVNKLGRSLGGLGKDAGTAAGKKGIGGLVSSMGAAVPIVGAVAIGVVGAATALNEMAKAAWEDKRQADRLAQTLSNIPGVTQKMIDKNEEWITSMQLATLVSDTDLRAGISKLAVATGDLGEAQRLATLATDVAVGTGASYTTVVTALAKATDGQTGALKKLVPGLDAGADGVLTMAEAEDQLGASFKGAAAEAAKNDPWKRIGIIWDELQEAIGSALIPALERLGDWFSKPQNMRRVQDMLDKVADLGEKVGQWLLGQLNRLIDWIQSPDFKRAVITWKTRFLVMKEEVESFIGAIMTVIGWIKSLITWIGKIDMPNLTLGGGGGIRPGEQSAGVGVSTQASTASAPPPQTVIVTEEQVYRAVQRLLMRGDARNGRLVMVR